LIVLRPNSEMTMSKPLTPKQRAFVAAWIENGGNGTQAAFQALGCRTPNCGASCASRMLKNAKVREEIERLCRRASLGPERWAEVLANAMEAETELVIGPGQVVKQPDHKIRLKAVDLTAKLLDAYPRSGENRQEHEHRHLHIEVSEPIEVMRFRVIHGRAPTELELKELIPASSSPDDT
jgi:phage terminase small subunit